MGLKLNGLVPSKPATPEDLAGKVVAIDVPNLVYAFYAVQLAGKGEVTPAMREHALRAGARGLTQRVSDLARMGARSVLVLDGPPHPLKRAHLEERNATRSVPAIGAAELARAVQELREGGTPVVHAPHDAEAQACAMAARGLVDVVATTDWDALAMGAPVLLRNLSGNPTAGSWTLVRADDAWAALGAPRERLAEAAVLMGCDYFPGFDRIGPKRALALVARMPFEEALASLCPEEARREVARGALRLLVEPAHAECGPLRWGPRKLGQQKLG